MLYIRGAAYSVERPKMGFGLCDVLICEREGTVPPPDELTARTLR
jgi:hypothetical protein